MIERVISGRTLDRFIVLYAYINVGCSSFSVQNIIKNYVFCDITPCSPVGGIVSQNTEVIMSTVGRTSNPKYNQPEFEKSSLCSEFRYTHWGYEKKYRLGCDIPLQFKSTVFWEVTTCSPIEFHDVLEQ
jgi:hypothetical protein